jgi:nucleolar protein 56
VQASVNDLAKFQRIVKMIAFHPFDSAENALENILAVTEHEMTADLRVSKKAVLFIKTTA